MLQILGESPTGATELGTLRVWNPTPHPVTTIVTTTLPFAQGSYFHRATDRWRAVNATSATSNHVEFSKLGVGWRDGNEPYRDPNDPSRRIEGAVGESWRHGRLQFVCDVPARSEKVVTIERAQPTIVPNFTLHADVLAALAIGWPLFTLGVGADSVDLFHVADRTWVAQNALVNVLQFRGRVPNTPFWAEALLQFNSAMRHARFWLWYGNSWIDDPLRTSVDYTIPGDIVLTVRGARPWIQHSSIKVQSLAYDGLDTTAVLMESTEASGFFPDGASQAITGLLTFGAEPLPSDTSADAESWRALTHPDMPLDLGVAETWPASLAFGPFGHVAPRPPWCPDDATYRARAVARAQKDYDDAIYANRGPWSAPQFGLEPASGSSGAQGGFGVFRGFGIASAGHPAGLRPLQRSAYQEVCRPVFFRFANGAPWSITQRPTFGWGMRPHHRDGADTFGKVRRDIGNMATPRNDPNNRWAPMSVEHATAAHTYAYALLTGDLLALRIADAHVESWRAEHTYPGSPGSSASSRNTPLGAARSRGRWWLMGTQLALVTGRPDFWLHVRERFEASELVYGSNIDHPTDEWVGFALRGTLSPSRLPHLRPWEELTAVQGYGAVHRVFGIERARTDALRVAKSMLSEAVQHRGPTAAFQTYRMWPGATWSAPGNPPFGTVVTCGAGTGRLLHYNLARGYESYVMLYDCTGTWGNGAPIVAATGAQLDWGTEVRFRYDTTELSSIACTHNGGQFHSPAQHIELEPSPMDPAHPLRHFFWGGITHAWMFGGVLQARAWAQETGDTAAEALAQAVLDSWFAARGAPGDGFLDDDGTNWANWLTVADPWA